MFAILLTIKVRIYYNIELYVKLAWGHTIEFLPLYSEHGKAPAAIIHL